MLGSLGENLTNTMKKLAGMSVIDKKVVKEVVNLFYNYQKQSKNVHLTKNLQKE